MILDEVRTIVLIDSGTIKAGTVTIGEAPKLGDTVENPWTQDNLKEIFLGIKRVFGNPNVRIVIDDSLCDENSAPRKEFWQKITAAASETGIVIDAYEAVSKARQRHENPMVGLAIKKDVPPAENALSRSFVPQKKNAVVRPLLIGLGVIILAATLVSAVFLYKQNGSGDGPSLVEPVASKPSPIVPIGEPTTTPALERSELKIKILNGSGVTGLAGKAKSLLEEKGYGLIETGNADNFDYEETVVRVRADESSLLDMLMEDLGQEYTVSSESAQTLESDSEFDAVIILGKE